MIHKIRIWKNNLSTRGRLLLFSTFLFILLIIFLGIMIKMNSASQKTIKTSFDFGQFYYATQINIHYGHDDQNSNEDVTVISGTYEGIEGLAEGKFIHLSVDDNLNLEESNLEHINTISDFDNNEYIFKSEKHRGMFYFRFKGDCFKKNDQEINNIFYFSIYKSDSIPNPKVEFMITGLRNYNISNVFPEPTEQRKSGNVIKYEYSYADKESIFDSSGIWLAGEHKFRKFNNQNWVFVLGMIIGSLFSGIIELLIAYFKEDKKKPATNKVHDGHAP